MAGPIRMLGAIADVTERKHAVQALAASERRFRAMFDGGVQLKTLLDLDCTCLEANRVALDFAGISLRGDARQDHLGDAVLGRVAGTGRAAPEGLR